MKKTIMVMATITIEGDHLNSGFIKRILQRISRWFRYKYNLQGDNFIVANVELSTNYVEIKS